MSKPRTAAEIGIRAPYTVVVEMKVRMTFRSVMATSPAEAQKVVDEQLDQGSKPDEIEEGPQVFIVQEE